MKTATSKSYPFEYEQRFYSVLVSKKSGSGFRELREKSGKSLRSVAREVKIDPSYLSKVEKGLRSVSEDLAEKLVKVVKGKKKSAA